MNSQSGDCSSVGRGLSSCAGSPDSIPAQHEPPLPVCAVMLHACSPRTWEAEAGVTAIQVYPWLLHELRASFLCFLYGSLIRTYSLWNGHSLHIVCGMVILLVATLSLQLFLA